MCTSNQLPKRTYHARPNVAQDLTNKVVIGYVSLRFWRKHLFIHKPVTGSRKKRSSNLMVTGAGNLVVISPLILFTMALFRLTNAFHFNATMQPRPDNVLTLSHPSNTAGPPIRLHHFIRLLKKYVHFHPEDTSAVYQPVQSRRTFEPAARLEEPRH